MESATAGSTLLTQGWLTTIGAALYFLDPGSAINQFFGAIDTIIVTDNALTEDQHADIAAITRFP